MTTSTRKNSITSVPADFQTAIAATGFGTYNIILILVCIPATWSTQFETTLMSFIIPTAACDLDLSPYQKGLLNSMAMIGMISTAFIWGVLIDTLGRRKLLLMSFVVNTIIVIGKSLAQEFYFLCIAGFFGGTITGGIYVAVNTYLLEFHSTEHRGKIQMIVGMMYSGANIFIPFMSSAILPLKFNVHLHYLHFYGWNLLILITSLASIISAVCFYFLPESPKFLMSTGNNMEALEVFKTMYRYNYGKSIKPYPIDTLVQEIEDKEESAANKTTWMEYLKSGVQQMIPLFGFKYGPKLLLACIIHSTFQMAVNVIRFYMPQIFQAIHDYQVASNGTSATICEVLEILRAPKPDEEYVCLVNSEDNFHVYLNSVITAAVALVSYVMVGTIVNIIGEKRIIISLGITASVCIACMYISKSTLITLILGSAYLSTSSICFDLFITVIMVTFPTTLRAMAFSLCLLLGRCMSVAGNIVFTILVEMGCALPFLTVGGLFLGASANGLRSGHLRTLITVIYTTSTIRAALQQLEWILLRRSRRSSRVSTRGLL